MPRERWAGHTSWTGIFGNLSATEFEAAPSGMAPPSRRFFPVRSSMSQPPNRPAAARPEWNGHEPEDL